MNNTYAETIYNYLSQPENYRAAKQIAGQIGSLDDRLVHDFWHEVREAVQQQLEPRGWEAAVSVPDWLSVRRPGWEGMGVNVDSLRGTPDFGLHCSGGMYDRTQVDALLQEAGVRESEGMKRKTSEWPCYRSLAGYSFWEPATLERILPSTRAAAVKDVADTIVSFVEKYELMLDRIHREAKL